MRSFLLFAILLASSIGVWAQSETPPEALNLYATLDKIGYPQDAKTAGVEGTVVAQVTVNEKGKVEDYEITESPSPVLSAAVEKHVSNLKFKPAKRNGDAIVSIVQVPFRFELPAGSAGGKTCTSVAEALADPLAVTELDLSGRSGSELSPELSKCVNVKVLILDGMGLTKVPTWIKALDLLEELSIADNMLKDLPSWLAKLPSLESIDLQENQIPEDKLRTIREKFETIDLLTD